VLFGFFSYLAAFFVSDVMPSDLYKEAFEEQSIVAICKSVYPKLSQRGAF
jgi:hypothetical protein